jgi:hypothetical protein
MAMRKHTTITATVTALMTAVAAAILVTAPPAPAQTWAPAATAAVHPGVQTYTEGSQCTANFIFTDGTNTYIGQAAHCSTTGSDTSVNGCTTPSLPIGTPVTILGASKPGVLAYNSWIAMQKAGGSSADECAYNDLALVKIDPADVAKVNPSIPVWGGPVALNTTGTRSGDAVYSYGNSILRLGVTALSPKIGTSTGDVGGGWSHGVTTITPGIPGDSGSAFLDAAGNALGDLSTLSISIPGGFSNNVSDLSHELSWLRAHESGTSLANLQLVLGTEPFNPNAVPVDTNRPVDDPVGGLSNFIGL